MTKPDNAPRVLVCTDFDDRPDFPGCCVSCHEDIAEGWAPSYEFDCTLPDGTAAHLCCRLRNWLGVSA